MRAEHAPKGRLVTPSLWTTLGTHVVASPGSRAALEVGGLSVHSFQRPTVGSATRYLLDRLAKLPRQRSADARADAERCCVAYFL